MFNDAGVTIYAWEAAQPEHVRRRGWMRVPTSRPKRSAARTTFRRLIDEAEPLRRIVNSRRKRRLAATTRTCRAQHDGVRPGVCDFERQHGQRRSRGHFWARAATRSHSSKMDDLQRAPEGSRDARAWSGTWRGARAIHAREILLTMKRDRHSIRPPSRWADVPTGSDVKRPAKCLDFVRPPWLRRKSLLRFGEFGDRPPEEPFDRLLAAEWCLVAQVYAARLRERCGDRYCAIANQVRRPDVARAP